jgi:hypothetical protein
MLFIQYNKTFLSQFSLYILYMQNLDDRIGHIYYIVVDKKLLSPR